MGAAADELKKLIKDDGPLVHWVGKAADVYGTMSGTYAAYGSAQEVLKALGILDEPRDPLEEVVEQLQEINQKMDEALRRIEEVKAKVAAGNELTKMQLLADPIAHAKTAFQHALAFIKDPDNEQIKNALDGLVGDSWIAVNKLSSPGYEFWKRLFAEDAVYSDIWTEPLYPDDAPADYVWDYRVALPAYLQVLEYQLFVFLSRDASYKSSLLNEMEKLGDFLHGVYHEILDNVAFVPPPAFDVMKYVIAAMDDANFCYYRKEGQNERFTTYDFIDPADGRRVKKMSIGKQYMAWKLAHNLPGGRWRLANYTLGAVERYSGYDCRAVFPPGEMKTWAALIEVKLPTYTVDYNGDFWNWSAVTVKQPAQFQRFYDDFLVSHSLRTLRKRNQLYKELGLPKLHAILRSFYSILGLAIPKELTERHTSLTAWSIREVVSRIPSGITGNTTPETPISVRQIAKMLAPLTASAAVSLRRLFLADEALTPA